MSIRRTILTSGGLASAIGVCLAILSAGTLVVFSAVAARVGLGDLSNGASVASPRNATKGPPAAITFPSTQEPSEENERTAATNNARLLDIIGSLDASTSSDALVDSATPNASGDSNDVGSEQVGALVSDIDAGGRNLLSARGRSSASRPRLPGGDARSGDEKDEPKDEKGDDRVAARKDDEHESDHGDDDDDDDDDGDSSGSRHGSRGGSRDGNRSGSRGGSGDGSRGGSRDGNRSGSRGESCDGSRDGHGATHVRVKAAKAKAQAQGHSRGDIVDRRSHHRDHDDDSDSSND